MKSANSNNFSLLLATSGLLFSGALFAQTVEVNPAGAIPAIYNLAQSWEWNTPADLQSWTAAGLTLEAGTPTDDGGGNGSVKGTAATNDPTFTSPVTTIAAPYRVIIEMRVKKESTDTTRMDLFWDDTAGGIGTAGKLVSIPSATLAPDNTFKIVRITLPFNKIVGQLDQLRFDPISDAAGIGKTVAIDYVRVYTEVPTPLSWDADTVTTDAQGGTGTWDQLTNNLWWNGASNTTWPASGARAIFAGTAGAVTVAGGGVSANIADFQTTGYTVAGGAIAIGSDSAKFTNSGTNITRIDAPLTGSAPLMVTGGTFVLGGNNTSLSGPVTQLSKLGITNDNAVGTGTLTMGASNNIFLSALDGDRTIANNVIFAGNRMLIENDAFGTGLSVGNLTIDGSLALNCTSPADLFLRKNLTVNGVVSGSNSNIGLLLASNVGTIRLTNAGNNFTGNITWTIGATVEADSNGALGALANSLKISASGGTLKMLAAFGSARPIVINNFGTGTAGTSTTLAQVNTNGFDSTWTGTISAPVFSTPAVAQQITTFVKQGEGILTLDSGGTTANNLRSGGIRVDGGTLKIVSGVITTLQSSTANGINGDCFLEINGGSLSTGNFAVGKSAGTATITLNSGTYTNTAELLLAFNLGDGIFNINGGLADLNQFSMVDKTGLTSTMNLNGGEVRLNFFNARANSVSNTAVANINFNGSTVRAKSTNSDFIETNTTTTINANVQAGGAIFDTTNGATSYSITIKQPLIHDPALGATLDGGLTKNGLGTLTLAPVAGPNTYTGTTTVNAGILAVSGSSIADAGKVSINTSGKLSIPASSNEIVATLFLDGVQQPAGVYGSSASTAAPGFLNDNFFDVAGAGTLTVTSGTVASGYANWASAFTSPALSNTAATADPDGDGLANSVEYIIGGDPRVSSQSGRPSASASAGNLVFTFSRVDSSETPDVTLKVQTSNDLSDWATQPSFTIGATTAASTAGVVVSENGTAADTITVTIPGAAKKFARLNVVTTP